jgi:uncharacterized C2H2 Zn-finger protein
MSDTRRKPYTTNQESWKTILDKNLKIPMNQRRYEWEEEHIIRFLKDIFNIFEEGMYVEKMGSIINLKYEKENYIFDGQQRILTTILILKVIGCLSPKLKDEVIKLLSVNTNIRSLTPEQKIIKDKFDLMIMPKIFCINPDDMEGLAKILNNKVKSWVEYLSNIDELESLDEDENYICNKCDHKISRKSDFIRHITKKHDYVAEKKITNLYDAFIEIYNYFTLKKYDDEEKLIKDEEKLIKLYEFIVYNIDVQFYDCNDSEYVSRIFDWENNRGKTVETLDIIKNPILVKIADDKKVEVYELWEKLKHKTNKIYKNNFGQKIFDIAIQLYNKKINRNTKKEDLFKHIIDSDDTYKEINKFFKIVEKLFEIMKEITENKYGRLINNTPRVCLNWEAYMWCFLPIFYTIGNIDKKLIKLMTKWYFRRIGKKLRGFNTLCYSNEFIKITNNVLKDKHYKYYLDFEKCLKKNKEEFLEQDKYVENIRNMNYKSTNATHLLLFLETCINTNSHIVPLDYTLEHVFPQKNKTNLVDQSLMDNIGNLTLLEGKSSECGHKGNSSLGAKPYEDKKNSYKESNCKTTRNIVENFENFTEDNIIERNKNMADLLNKHTNY